jgi:predicted membrane-bound spermidine synthase
MPVPLPGRTALAGIFFFLSGAAALVYQVVWQRILALQSGVGVYSIAIIVAAFMVGLGAGSHLGGVWCERVSPRRALAVFASLEIAIGSLGALSGPLMYDLLSLRLSHLFHPLGRAALVQFGCLAPPTLLMGMSLPFLVRALVRDVSDAPRTIGSLYALNTLGAAAGALITPWVLLRYHGMRAALLCAAVANVVAGLGALTLVRGTREVTSNDVAPSTPPLDRRPLPLWLALYALGGFCALSLEILWFRLIDVAVKSTGFTFGTVLAVYLAGCGLGTLAGIRLAGRLRRPLRAFLASQCGILLYACLAVLVLVRLPPETPFFRWFFDLWGGRVSFNLGGAWHTGSVLRLYLLLPLALYGPPTALMGVAFVALQRAVQDDARRSGRRVGLLQAANILGCVGGSLLVGLVALNWLGSAGTLRVLAAIGAGLAVLALALGEGRRLFTVLAAAFVALSLAMPGEQALWRRLHGMTERDPAVAGEDATGVVLVSEHDNGLRRVWVNGRHHSILPFGGIHTALGAAPAAIHPGPEQVAIIGLGSGDTAWASGFRRPQTRRLTAFEICAPQLRMLRDVADGPDPPPKLQRFLEDPRLAIRLADGRNALLRADERYDLIEMDALYPSSPYSGNLYSLEFYRLCASRLRTGGLMCTWAPTPRVHATFQSAFPHVLELADGQILVGSADPIPVDPPAWQARLTSGPAVAYLGLPRVNELLALLRNARPAPRQPVGPADVNRDLFPRDELNSP